MSIELVRQGDRWVVASCAITPTGDVPPGGLSARQLRRVTLGALTRRVSTGASGAFLNAAPNATVEREHTQTPHPGRRGRSQTFYAVWAARYTDEAAVSRRPIIELADRHRRTPAQIRNYLTRARQLGLLTRPSPGLAGGELTDKARAILDTATADDSQQDSPTAAPRQLALPTREFLHA